MKQFIYQPADAGLLDWPSGILRLEGIEETENPAHADVFICPGSIRIFETSSGVLDRAKLRKLPHFNGNESRHVFFDVSDNFTKEVNLPIIFLKCDARPWMLANDPNTIQLAWPVEDYSECMDLPASGFKYDVSFQGWVTSHLTREQSVASIVRNGTLKADVAAYTDFTGYIFNEPEGIRRRKEFRRSMRESRLSLCPESISSVFPYRYWECLSAGRVPLLVGSDFLYPFADRIDYASFTVTCSRDRAGQASLVAEEFLQTHSDKQIVEMGKLARKAWETYLDSRLWPKIMAEAVREKMEARCPTAALL